MNLPYKLFYLFFPLAFSLKISAQPCQYLAYEGFPYADSSILHDAYGGIGWESPWNVQNNNISFPGFMVAAHPNMQCPTLLSSGNHVMGGISYLSAGRKLDLSINGPFSAYRKSNGKLGQQGTTLYFSAIIRKEAANDEKINVMLQGGNNVAWVTNANPRIQMGYFGTGSNIGADRFWGISIDGNIYNSNKIIQIGRAALLVVKIEFLASGGTVSAWINPTQISGAEPSPDIVVNHPVNMEYLAVALYLGNSVRQGSLDEIRLAGSYACATPDSFIAVNTPPFAAFNASPSDGIGPITVNFDGSASADVDGPLTAEYIWSYGDGQSDTTVTPFITHIYSFLGVFRPTLRIRDSGGLTHTAYGTVTVRDSSGTYPCYTYMESISRPSCNNTYGAVRVYPGNATVTVLNSFGIQVTTGDNNYNFDSLTIGTYTVLVSNTAGCRDSLSIYISFDSSNCPGWTVPSCLNLGINLDGTSYYDRQRVFKNFFTDAGEWITFNASGSSPWDTQRRNEMPVDSSGYPLQIPFSSSLGPQKVRGIISANGHMPPGNYILLYDGNGTIQFSGLSVISSIPGRIEFTIAAGYYNNVWFNLDSSTSGNHIRNIRILRPQHENNYLQNPFYEVFLDKLQAFSTIRFMDVLATNSAFPHLEWNDRKNKHFYSQSIRFGMSYEYIIEMANITQKHIWVNIPHTASEDYIRNMARMFRDSLDCNLEIYLEYSNEVWNWMFPQAHEVAQNEPQNIAYPRRYAERCRKAFKIWTEEFSDQPSRLHRVLNTQGAYPTYGAMVLAHLNPNEYDYLSPAWYFSYNGSACSLNFDSTTTAAEIVQCSRDHWRSTLPTVRADYRNASLYGKKIVNYEGGQHMTDFGIYPHTQAVWDAQFHPDMYNLYNEVIDTLKRMGTDLAIAYNLARINETEWGSFGHLDDIDIIPDSINAPKWIALMHNICPLQSYPVFDSTITYYNDMLNVQFGADSYQWFDCSSGLAIPGETSATLSQVPLGSFSAELIFGGCIYRTDCFTITNSKILQKNTLQVIPNPNSGSFWVNFEELGKTEIYNLQGIKIFEKVVNNPQQIDLQDLPNGIYILSFKGQYVKFVLY